MAAVVGCLRTKTQESAAFLLSLSALLKFTPTLASFLRQASGSGVSRCLCVRG